LRMLLTKLASVWWFTTSPSLKQNVQQMHNCVLS
jgi:hypothetical protein